MDYRQQGYRPTTQAAKPGRKPQARGKKRKKRRGGPVKTFLLLVLFAVLATVGTMGYLVYDEINSVVAANTFYRGVYVDDVALYGATPQEAYDYILGRAREELSGWSIDLVYGSDMRWSITTDTLGISDSLEAVVADEINKAFAQGRTGGVIEKYKRILSLRAEPYRAYTTDVQSNESGLDELLTQIAQQVYIAPADAQLELNFTRRNPIVVYPETMGRALDVGALKAEIMQMVNAMQAGTITLSPQTIAPGVLAAELEGQIAQLSSYSTTIARNSTAGRNMNIEIGCEAFHGREVRPGEKVSFNDITGKRSRENGYQLALEIVNGEYVEGYGGGICQVSSTLYNAVVQAGLEVVKRQPHGLKPNYIDMGADATVADRGIDFVFRNDTDASIWIVARLVTSGNTKTCQVQIYGKPDSSGYRYSLDHETIETIPIPEPETVRDTKGEHVIYTDQTHTVKGSVGHRVRTYLVTRDATGSVISRKELYVDTYSAVAPKIYVGVTPR